MSVNHTDLRWWQRLAQRFASSRFGSWLFSYTLHHIDRFLMRISGGRVSIPTLLAGLPVVRLTVVGAKTGQERTVPLLGLRDGDQWILVASNWGSEEHPAWYYNVKANPEVELTYNDQTDEYVAREATGEEREEYWQQAKKMYLGYEPYKRRSGDRQIPVIVLSPKGQ